jgi:hypothetical protein
MSNESSRFSLGVYRFGHNQPGEPQPDSPLAFDFHNRRKKALHKIFNKDTSLKVRN